MFTERLKETRKAASILFWMWLLQGVSLLILGGLVLFYPQILFALVAATFIWIGLIALLIAWRILQFKKQLPKIFTVEPKIIN